MICVSLNMSDEVLWKLGIQLERTENCDSGSHEATPKNCDYIKKTSKNVIDKRIARCTDDLEATPKNCDDFEEDFDDETKDKFGFYETTEMQNNPRPFKPPLPQQIYDFLNGNIIGHYVMKKALSVAINNHYCNTICGGRLCDPKDAPDTLTELVKETTFGNHAGDLHVQKDKKSVDSGLGISVDKPRLPEDEIVAKSLPRPVPCAELVPSTEYLSPIVSRVIIEASSHRVHLKKSNTLTFDPTGSSKPLAAIAQNVAQYLKVPYVRCDCSHLIPQEERSPPVPLLSNTLKFSSAPQFSSSLANESPSSKKRPSLFRRNSCNVRSQLLSGYTGQTITDHIERLFRNADFDPSLTERGIVMLDGLDKIGLGSEQDAARARSIVRELLNVIEGQKIHLKDNFGKEVTLDTSKIFFVCFGVYKDIFDDPLAVEKSDAVSDDSGRPASEVSEEVRKSSKVSVETNVSEDSGNGDEYQSDLEEDEYFSYYDEAFSYYRQREAKIRKLVDEWTSSSLPLCQQLWGMKDVELKFAPEALEVMADLALEQKAGEDGLKTILEKLLMNVKFDIMRDTNICAVEITEEAVLGKERPHYLYRPLKPITPALQKELEREKMRRGSLTEYELQMFHEMDL